jgi:arylsulfatase A-like enzyme
MMPSKTDYPGYGKAVLFALLLTAAACGGGHETVTEGHGAPASGPPSLLLVTVDTWRWDYIGASGMGKVPTPALDRLARGGVYDAELETPCPLTTPSHATLFTGLLPLNHRILDCVSYSLPAELPTLAQAFKAKGYGTAAFISSQTLVRHFGLDRGFDHYDDGGMNRTSDSYWQTATRDGAITSAAALEYLKARAPTAPLFLWVHYFDLHIPHRARPAYDAKFPNAYAAQVAFVDD